MTKNECNVNENVSNESSLIISILVLFSIFSYNVSNNGTLRWQDVKDFLSQCGDDLPEELDTMFQNVSIDIHLSFDFRLFPFVCFFFSTTTSFHKKNLSLG